MKFHNITLALAFTLALAPLRAADSAPAGEPPAPKPGPEHAMLAKDAGVWDAEITMWFGPGEPTRAKGVWTAKMDMGGFWQVSDFDSEMMGAPFRGHQLTGFDQNKKKFVTVWADSMGSWMMVSEGTYDAAKKTLTMFANAAGMDGKPQRDKMVTTYPDDDHQIFTMYTLDGKTKKWNRVMEISYTRRK